MTTPKKTRPGAPFQFSAKFYNKLIDNVNWTDKQRNLAGAGQQGGSHSETKLTVKNNSGDSVVRFGVLEITDKLGAANEFKHLKVVQGEAPTSSLGPVVVVQQAVANSKLVNAVASGVTMARVDVRSTSDTHAEPVAGETVLRSGTAGRFRILHPLTTTGEQDVLVRFEGGGASNSTGLPKVKNLSGFTVPEWGFLLIDGADPIPSANLAGFKSSPVFRGVAPLQNNDFSVYSNKRLVSVPGGAAPGETVDCILDGRVPARIYSKYQRAPLMAHISRQEGILDVEGLEAFHEQTNFGFPILYREPGLGIKWGLIDLMPQNQPASIHGTAINGLYGGIPGKNLTSASPNYSWKGSPFDNALSTNGNVRISDSPTGIRFDGPSAWTGTITFSFLLSYSSLSLLGSTGLYRVPGVSVSLTFFIGTLGGTYSRRWGDPVTFTLPPSVIAAVDAARIAPGGSNMYQSLTLPFTIQTDEGILEKTGTNFEISVGASRTFTGDQSVVSFSPIATTLIMHEIDPLLPKFIPGPVVTPSGGFLSSIEPQDPFAQLKTGISAGTGLLTSNGFRSVAPGSGFGFS